MVKKWLKKAAYCCWLILTVGGLMELAYRFQWVDFYRTEWRLLNPGAPRQGSKILVLGDSFTATADTYLTVLRDSLPDGDVRNAAVPGVGIREMSVVAAARLREFQPDILLYQVYTGNDLWDIRKTTSSGRIPWWRNLYWKASDYSLFLRYLNYKTGQIRTGAGLNPDTLQWRSEAGFAPERYNAREKLIFQAEPDLIRNSTQLIGVRADDFAYWTRKMDEILGQLPPATHRVILMVIPHCSQVSPLYQQRTALLGAVAGDSTLLNREYPLLESLRRHYRKDPRVMICSMLPALQQAEASGTIVYFENDPHLNSKGQAICGKALWEACFSR